MVFFINLSYFFRQAVAALRENPGMSLMALGTTTFSIVILGAFWLLFLNLSLALEHWTEKVQLTVYLSDRISAGELERIRRSLDGMEKVEAVTYVSKGEALKSLKEMLSGEEGMLEGLSENPLPASLSVSFKRGHRGLDAVAPVAERVARMAGVDEVDYGRGWVERLDALLRIVKFTTLLLSALIALGVIFIISSTIRLTLYARQEEIEIMELVGAEGFFIKAPYLIEGVAHGLVGALLALAVLKAFMGLFALEGFEALWTGGFRVRFFPLPLALALALGGGLLGALGSHLSLRRFLKF